MVIRRGVIFWVNLESTVGTEIRKTRPALIISPDDLNHALPHVIIAPSIKCLSRLHLQPPSMQQRLCVTTRLFHTFEYQVGRGFVSG
jgi:mRNA-degrading endonuclease toxin of MazEF toxin-antitoxin module